MEYKEFETEQDLKTFQHSLIYVCSKRVFQILRNGNKWVLGWC